MVPVFDEVREDYFLLELGVADERVVDGNSLDVEIFCVVLLKKAVADIGDIESGVGFTRLIMVSRRQDFRIGAKCRRQSTHQVSLSLMEVKSIDKVLPESFELSNEINLVQYVRFTD